MSFICLFYIRNNIIISSSSFVSNKQNIQSFSTYSELTLIRIRLIKSTFYRNIISIDAKKRKRKKIDKWLFVQFDLILTRCGLRLDFDMLEISSAF